MANENWNLEKHKKWGFFLPFILVFSTLAIFSLMEDKIWHIGLMICDKGITFICF